MSGETQPVAWRVKDYADGWTVHRYEHEAHRAARNGNLIEPLYTRAPVNRPSPEVGESALVERLRVMAGADGRITCMAEYNGGAVASSQSIAAALCADAADEITNLQAELAEARKQPFERYPALASWIERLANTSMNLSLGDWMVFVGALNMTIERIEAELGEARKERDEAASARDGHYELSRHWNREYHRYRKARTQAEAQRDAALAVAEDVASDLRVLSNDMANDGVAEKWWRPVYDEAVKLEALASLSPAKDEDPTHD